MSNKKSPQVSRTLLSILADLNNALVCMVCTRPHIFKSSNPCTNPLVILTRTPFTIGITVIFLFHSFFNFLTKSRYLSLAFFLSYSVVSRNSKIRNSASSLFLFFIILRSGHLADIMWSVCISKSQRSLCVSFARTDSGLCIYHLFVCSNLNSCTLPSGSHCTPIRALSYTVSALIM